MHPGSCESPDVHAERLVVERPGQLRLMDSPVSGIGSGDARVIVAFAGICHTDEYLLNGNHPAARYPVVPGHEFSGFVAEVAPESGFLVGDRVAVMSQLTCGHCIACIRGLLSQCPTQRELGSTLDGGWQTEVTVPVRALVRVPEQITMAVAALTEPSANAFAAVRRARVNAQDDIAIFGPGTIGLLAVQHARRLTSGRIFLIGTPDDERRLKVGSQLGADVILSGEATSALLELTSGRGVDVALQCAPSSAATATAIGVAAIGARIVVEGYTGGSQHVPVEPDRLVERELSIVGVRGWSTKDFRSALAVAALVGSQLDSLVTDIFTLHEYEHALARSRKTSETIKVMFENPDASRMSLKGVRL